MNQIDTRRRNQPCNGSVEPKIVDWLQRKEQVEEEEEEEQQQQQIDYKTTTYSSTINDYRKNEHFRQRWFFERMEIFICILCTAVISIWWTQAQQDCLSIWADYGMRIRNSGWAPLNGLSFAFILPTSVFRNTFSTESFHHEGHRNHSITKYQQQQQSSSSFFNNTICQWIPTNQSSSFLWNTHLGWIYEALLEQPLLQSPKDNSNNDLVDPAFDQQLHHQTKWLRELLEFLSPQYLKTSVKSKPMEHVWQRFISKISERIMEQDNPEDVETATKPITIVVVGGEGLQGKNACRLPKILQQEEKQQTWDYNDDSTSSQQCSWPFRLERTLNQLANKLQDGMTKGKPTRKYQRHVQVFTLSVPYSTTEFATRIIQYGLWPLEWWWNSATKMDPFPFLVPDIVIHAYSGNDLYVEDMTSHDANFHTNSMLNRNRNDHATSSGKEPKSDLGSINYVDSRRRKLQEFVRAGLLFHPSRTVPRRTFSNETSKDNKNNILCSTKQRNQPLPDAPIVILFDDYVGPVHDSILLDTINARLYQRIADWFHIPFISYASMIRSWVYGTTTEDIFSPAWNRNQDTRASPNLHYGTTAHFAVVSTILFNLWDYTIDYCSSSSVSNTQHQSKYNDFGSLVSQNVQNLITYTVPPKLTLDLKTEEITAKWKDEQKQQKLQRINETREWNVKIQDYCAPTEPNNKTLTSKTSTTYSHAICPVFTYRGLRNTATVTSNMPSYDSILSSTTHPYVMNVTMGWTVQPDGSLFVQRQETNTEERMVVKVPIPIAPLAQSASPTGPTYVAHLFVVTHPETTKAIPTVATATLKVRLAGTSLDTDGNSIKELTIHGTHRSLSTVVGVPYSLYWRPSNSPAEKQNELVLELIFSEGHHMEVIGLLLCQDTDL